jgi:hypothetical protein
MARCHPDNPFYPCRLAGPIPTSVCVAVNPSWGCQERRAHERSGGLRMRMNFSIFGCFIWSQSLFLVDLYRPTLFHSIISQPNPESHTPSHSHASCLYMNLASLLRILSPLYFHTRTSKDGAHQQHLLPASHIHEASRNYLGLLMDLHPLPAHPGHLLPSRYRHQ